MSRNIENVEIFGVGTWNGMKFTSEDLQEIAKNTNKVLSKGNHKPPLKLGHSTSQILKGQSDGDPAMGWIENIKVQGQKLIADFVKVPNILVGAFKEGLYRQVSVEMRHIDHTGWILTGVALLGADLPAVKTLNDLEAFLSESFNADNSVVIEQEGELCFSTTEPILKGHEMSDQAMQELEALKAKLAAVEAENASFKVKETEKNFSEKTEGFLSPYKKDVEDGKLPPHVFSKIENSVLSQKCNFSEGKELSIPASLMREVAVAYSESLPKGESAHSAEAGFSAKTEKNIDEKIELEIAKVQASGTTDYFSARNLVFKAQPELSEAYKQYTIDISQGRL